MAKLDYSIILNAHFVRKYYLPCMKIGLELGLFFKLRYWMVNKYVCSNWDFSI